MGIISSHPKNFEDKPMEKEGDDESWRDGYIEYMERGPCKEAYINHLNIMNRESLEKLDMCKESHSDYHQHLLAASEARMKTLGERATKELLHSDIPLDELSDEEVEKLMATAVEEACCKESLQAVVVNCFLTDEEIDVLRQLSFLQEPIEKKENVDCKELWMQFYKCVDDHPDHPFFALKNASHKQVKKDRQALFPQPHKTSG